MEAPITEPMRLVLECLSGGGNPSSLYQMGQLRLILQGLMNRGLIRANERSKFVLTAAGRNLITASRRRRD